MFFETYDIIFSLLFKEVNAISCKFNATDSGLTQQKMSDNRFWRNIGYDLTVFSKGNYEQKKKSPTEQRKAASAKKN